MKIVAYYIGENVQDFIQMSIKSLLTFIDGIVFVDGGSTDSTLEKIRELNDERIEILKIPYEHWSHEANGKQRNNALSYLKEKFKDEEIWILRIDPDEVMDDNGFRLKQLAEYGNKYGIDCFNLKMEHFIWCFGLLDASLHEHYVPHAFFKLQKNLLYREAEHPILQNNRKIENSDICTLWHLRECLQVFEYRKKYLNNLKNSDIHSSQDLYKWYYDLLLGKYKVKLLDNIDRLPKKLREDFYI